MKNKYIKIVQHNLNKSRIAALQLRDYCFTHDIDAVLLQEPIIQQGKVHGFEDLRHIPKGNSAGAAIIIINSQLKVIEIAQFTSEYIVTARVGGQNGQHGTTIMSAYIKYNMPTQCFIEKLQHVLAVEDNALIGADTNAHSTKWHCLAKNC